MNVLNYNTKLMKTTFLYFVSFFVATITGFAQTNPVIDVFPKGTVLYGNIPYNNDNLPKHLLDIYLPPNSKGKVPLVIFIHGGGWLGNDKRYEV